MAYHKDLTGADLHNNKAHGHPEADLTLNYPTHNNSSDHTQNTDTDLDATFKASLKNTDNHTSGTTNKVYTVTEQTKLSGIATGAQVNNISDVNATDLTDGGATTLHSHSGGAGDTLITGASGAVASGAAPTTTLQILTANNADIPTTTVVTQLTAQTVGVGWWLAEYWVIWQSNVTTTGITFILQHTGTATNFQSDREDIVSSTTALATTGVMDQEPTTLVVGFLPSNWTRRANNVALGPNAGVRVINVNEITRITALFLVTVSGDLLLQANSEIASTITRVMAGTTARYTRLS